MFMVKYLTFTSKISINIKEIHNHTNDADIWGIQKHTLCIGKMSSFTVSKVFCISVYCKIILQFILLTS